jgi:dihydrodiol dehydrogenase / D-xylose 1-dehydrogenase (NADP)
MTERVGWGILGTGKIAVQFADDLQHVPGAVLTAVGSRSPETAEAFGTRYRIPHRHASYAALVNDPDVDIVYVSTPHTLHAENSRLALEAGRHVLCEKPLTLNAKQAADLILLARERTLFLMEAMWMRFLPAIVRVRQILAEGTLGDVRMLSADFGLQFEFDPRGRLFAPELGGGALLDLGVYPVSFAHMVLGRPERIVTLASMGRTGVDDQSGIVFRYPQGQIACLHTAMGVGTPTEATLAGTRGRLRVHPPFYRTDDLTLEIPGQPHRRFHHRRTGNGLHYQALDVMECLRQGKKESGTMPLQESLAVMESLDAIRAQWGLKYPGEEDASLQPVLADEDDHHDDREHDRRRQDKPERLGMPSERQVDVHPVDAGHERRQRQDDRD